MFADGDTDCKNCPSGKFSDTVGSQCFLCPEGKYQTKQKQASCDTIIKCGPGNFDASGGKELSTSRCRLCPSGKFRLLGSELACKTCPAGKFQQDTGQAFCLTKVECAPGKFEREVGSCIDCPREYFRLDTQEGSCVSCPAGEQSVSRNCTMHAVRL
jgi:hypothetical protein